MSLATRLIADRKVDLARLCRVALRLLQTLPALPQPVEHATSVDRVDYRVALQCGANASIRVCGFFLFDQRGLRWDADVDPAQFTPQQFTALCYVVPAVVNWLADHPPTLA